MLDGAGGVVRAVASEAAPGVVDAVDVDEVVRRIDLDEVLARLDLDEVLDRIDINRLLDRIDVDRLLDRVDVDALIGRVDVEALVARTELAGVVARSTAGIATITIDLLRSIGVGLDLFLQRWVRRLLRRDVSGGPGGPPLLVEAP